MISLFRFSNLENYIKYIFYLCPLFIIIGSVTTNLFMLLLFTTSVLWKYKEKIIISLKDYEILFLIFLIYIFTTNVINLNYNGLLKVLFFSLFFINLIIIKKLPKFVIFSKKNSIIFLLFFIYLIADSFFQFYIGFNSFGIESASGDRVSSFFGDEAILGSYFSKFGLIFYCLIINGNYNFKNYHIIKWVPIILYFTVIFLSGERVSFLFFLFLFSIYLLKLGELKIIILTISTTIIFFAIIFNSNFLNNYKNVYLTFVADLGIIDNISEKYSTQELIDKKQIEYIDNLKALDNCTSTYPLCYDILAEEISNNLGIDKKKFKELENKNIVHTNYFIDSYHGGLFLNTLLMSKENIFFGVGIDRYKSLCIKDTYEINDKIYMLRCSTHPHNVYLELLVETGLIGILIFAVFLFYYFKYLLKKSFYLKDKFFDAILITNIGLFFPLATTGSIFSSGYFIYFYFYIILAVCYRNYDYSN